MSRYVFTFFIALMILLAVPTYAQKLDPRNLLDETVEPTGLPQEELSPAVGNIIEKALMAVGLIFFVLMVYAGFMWMTARDNEDQASKARDTFITATIGVIIIVGAYTATYFILSRVQSGAVGPDAKDVQACCQDKVNAAGWACRITTQIDCQTVGLQCEQGDQFCGENDFNFLSEVTERGDCVATCNVLNRSN